MHKKTALMAVMVLSLAALAGGGLFLARERLSAPAEAGAIYYCPMHPTYTSDRPGKCPICHMDLVKRESEPEPPAAAHAGHSAPEPAAMKTFSMEEFMKLEPKEICLLHKCKMGQCVMTVTEDMARAGKCPHCGEDLGVIVKDAPPAGYSEVTLNAEKQQLIDLKTAAAVKKKLRKEIRAVGTVAHDPELYQAQAEYIEALQAVNKAREGKISEVVEQAERLAASTRIRLKHMGLTDDLIAEIGKQEAPDHSLLYAHGAGGKVWIYAQVYEYELPAVRPGQEARLEISASNGETVIGRIRAIDPMIDPKTRTARIRLEVQDTQGIFKPDMYVNVTIVSELGEALTIPKEAVFDTGTRKIIFVESAAGKYLPREISVGSMSDQDYEITRGLNEGEKVVVSGNFLMDSESRLKAGLESAAGEHQHG